MWKGEQNYLWSSLAEKMWKEQPYSKINSIIGMFGLNSNILQYFCMRQVNGKLSYGNLLIRDHNERKREEDGILLYLDEYIGCNDAVLAGFLTSRLVVSMSKGYSS